MPRAAPGLHVLACLSLLGLAQLAQAQPDRRRPRKPLPRTRSGLQPAPCLRARVVLSISGRLLQNGLHGGPALLDQDQLAALPQHSLSPKPPGTQAAQIHRPLAA